MAITPINWGTFYLQDYPEKNFCPVNNQINFVLEETDNTLLSQVNFRYIVDLILYSSGSTPMVIGNRDILYPDENNKAVYNAAPILNNYVKSSYDWTGSTTSPVAQITSRQWPEVMKFGLQISEQYEATPGNFTTNYLFDTWVDTALNLTAYDGMADWVEELDLPTYVNTHYPSTGLTRSGKILTTNNYGSNFINCTKYRGSDKHYISFFNVDNNYKNIITKVWARSYDSNKTLNAYGEYSGIQATYSAATNYVNNYILDMQVGIDELNKIPFIWSSTAPYSAFSETRDSFIRIYVRTDGTIPGVSAATSCYDLYQYEIEKSNPKNLRHFVVSYKTKNGGWHSLPMNYMSTVKSKTVKDTYQSPHKYNNTFMDREISVFKNQKQSSLILNSPILNSNLQIGDYDELLSSPQIYIYNSEWGTNIPVTVQDSEFVTYSKTQDYVPFYQITFNKAFMENTLR